MIEGYGFATHVLPRMIPSLAFVAFGSLAWLVPLKAAGSERWILLGGVLVATATIRAAVRALIPRLPRLSRTTTVAILAGYTAMPVAVPLIQLAIDGTVTPPGGRLVGLLGFVVFFFAAFAATLLANTVTVEDAARPLKGWSGHDLAEGSRPSIHHASSRWESD
jgi:hypothetical protein